MSTEVNGDLVSWVHFGDLHITGENEPNYQDFLTIIEHVNANLAGQIDFAILPGDNADDGTEEQFRLVKHAVEGLRVPLHILPGDHDRKPGSLDAFYKMLGAERLPEAITVSLYRCLFLDIVSAGTGGPDFRLGADQIMWLERELSAAERANVRSVVFMHAYPADLRENAEQVCDLFTRYRVVAVDMGHTHYNELANDGHTIYAAMRSTGQIEEGPVGFSVAAIDRGIVSWRFKPLDAAWPFVLITSPADRRLITNPEAADQVVHGQFDVRALAWSGDGIDACSCRIDDGPWLAMARVSGTRSWQCGCEAPNRDFRLTVRTSDAAGKSDADTIRVAGRSYRAPQRRADGSDADAIGAWPEKHIHGTQLGPNRNGRKW
jgi:3',5'-cyclic-AMP phosphodiesterase